MNESTEREAFEAWMTKCAGYPFARQFANLMWKTWQARGSQSAPSPVEDVRAKALEEAALACEALRKDWAEKHRGDMHAFDGGFCSSADGCAAAIRALAQEGAP